MSPSTFDPLDPDQLDPAATALVVFDMLECYREKIEEAGVIPTVAGLIAVCRKREVPIFYARADHRADGRDANRTLADVNPEFEPWRGPQRFTHRSSRDTFAVLAELAPEQGDYEILKHRWNAFFQTPLDLSLRARGVNSIVLVGGSAHVGVASTAYAARDLDYQVVVIRDCLTGYEPQRSFFLDRVFPRMCRVRTAGEAIAMMDRVRPE